MRLVYIALIVLLTVALLMFKFQNLDMVTVTFLSWSASLPMAIWAIVIYVMGMVTGGALLGLLRTIVRRAAPKLR